MKKAIARVALLATATTMTLELPAEAAVRKSYVQHRLVRAEIRTESELRWVLDNVSVILTHWPRVGSLDLVLSPSELRALTDAGIAAQVESINVQEQLERQVRKLPHVSGANPWFEQYQDQGAIDAYIDTLQQLAPDRVTVLELGQSLEGRAMRALRITNGSVERPSVLVTGTQHAREWISPMVTTCLADALVRNYDSDPELKRLVDGLVFYVVPVVNPDGYVFSWENERFWRKNRRGGFGVDINRNWGSGFGVGVPPNQGSEVYPGTEAFSEPESRNLRDFMLEIPDLKLSIDYHSAAEVVLLPFGYKPERPAKSEKYDQWGSILSDKLSNTHDVRHRVSSIIEFAGTNGGISVDYVEDQFDAMSFAIELREGKQGDVFLLPPEQIVPSCEENLAAFVAISQEVLKDAGPPADGAGGSAGAAGAPGEDGLAGAGGSAGAPEPMSPGGTAGGAGDSAGGSASPTGAGGTVNQPPVAAGGAGATPVVPGSTAGTPSATPMPPVVVSSGGSVTAEEGCSCSLPGRASSHAFGGLFVLWGLFARRLRRR